MNGLAARGVFVTGTDTGVGKTVVSAALLAALRGAGPVCYWKPVQTGIEADDDTATVRRLANCSESEIRDRGIRLERPLSPHLSARLAGVAISVDLALRAWAPGRAGFWIVEGAGGVLVPLNDEEMMIDLIAATGLPAVIVARSALGTINHTLLTIEALRRRKLKIAGVVINGDPNPENRRAIADYGGVDVLFELPRFDNLAELVAWSNKAPSLASFVQSLWPAPNAN